MIVAPDFLTHWKTLMLIGELNDKAAPLYVIALWSHCQQRRCDTFKGLSPGALKSICRYDGDAEVFHSALANCGFIDVKGDTIIAHGWAEINSKLVANWDNGSKGGRPPQKRKKTQRKPNGNPTQDWGNPQGTDKSRVEKIGLEEIRGDQTGEEPALEKPPAPPKTEAVDFKPAQPHVALIEAFRDAYEEEFKERPAWQNRNLGPAKEARAAGVTPEKIKEKARIGWASPDKFVRGQCLEFHGLWAQWNRLSQSTNGKAKHDADGYSKAF